MLIKLITQFTRNKNMRKIVYKLNLKNVYRVTKQEQMKLNKMVNKRCDV